MPITINGTGPVDGITSINTSVSSTELGYLDGVTSGIQSQINTSGGLVKIVDNTFSAQSTISVNNCFTNAYENYRLMVSLFSTNASQGGWQFRLRAGGVDNSAASYNNQELLAYGTTIQANAYNASTYIAGGFPVSNNASQKDHAVIDIFGPAIAAYTNASSVNYGYQSNVAAWIARISGHQHQVSSAFDGFTLSLSGGFTFTGTLRVYGYRN